MSTNLCPEQDTLKFESRFESANLARAIMITPNFYELHLRSDMYTNRHMQWFYFRITNTKKGFLYRYVKNLNTFKIKFKLLVNDGKSLKHIKYKYSIISKLFVESIILYFPLYFQQWWFVRVVTNQYITLSRYLLYLISIMLQAILKINIIPFSPFPK